MYKTAIQLERYFKGVSNHHRIRILDLLSRNPGMSLDEISANLGIHLATASEHTRRLKQAGLIQKSYKGRMVSHELSPYGERMYKFLSNFK